ncbi:MAG: double-strand break repair helicase HerA and related ATPase [Frankiaceae bacterium]|jgi:DNA helicase HerA-like ATPase|nr:double-strand break repair helicase HerA and related ATPase [Frankiaceae bacterium]
MPDDILALLRTGYAFEGPAIDLGAAVVDGAADADTQVRLPLAMMNRHGLVAGATGTGKTKTLQLMAEQLAAGGVPVFLADVKGDVSGIATPGEQSDRISKRVADVGGNPWVPTGFPAEFYALGGIGPGIPLRARMTSFGPTLLSKVLGLNDVQTSSLGLVFHYADGAGLDLDDVKDLRAVIGYLASDDGAKDLEQLGGLSKATAGVLLRELVSFSDQGADAFFGEPEFDSADLLRVAPDGRGIVSCLELPAVQDRPALFSTFLMWLLADLFHDLPEVGDVEKPKLVFFFDEAHLLFHDASKDFLDSIAQTVRLIRSKGIGVFFVTQTPTDVPDEVLAQLGNRVQHALRSFTPADAKALKATVSTFPRSSYDLETLLTQLGIGEAVVTVLSENGAPTPVAWTRLRPPASRMGPLEPATLSASVSASPLAARYSAAIDDESAFEKLQSRAPTPAAAQAERQAAPPPPVQDAPLEESHRTAAAGGLGAAAGILASPMFRSFARSAATVAGREIARSIFGTAPRRRSASRRRH